MRFDYVIIVFQWYYIVYSGIILSTSLDFVIILFQGCRPPEKVHYSEWMVREAIGTRGGPVEEDA